MAVSQPHLPKAFVREHMKSSMYSKHPDFLSSVFTHELHDVRLLFTDAKTSDVINKNTMETKNIYFPGYKDVRPILHVCVPAGDYLMLCELLRLGADPRLVDERGDTVLLATLRHLVLHKSMVKGRLHDLLGRLSDMLPDRAERTLRLSAMARVLIEHHSDVSFRGRDGSTPLTLACSACDFDVIELLLKHGANSMEPLLTNFEGPGMHSVSLHDRERYCELAGRIQRERDPAAPRPPRPCPCFSGKPLTSCHQFGDHPYPLHFLCPCGSGHAFKSCCASDPNANATEHWDEEEGWGFITSVMESSILFSASGLGDGEALLEFVEAQRREGRSDELMCGGRQQRKKTCHDLLDRLEKLAEDGLIDRGFVHAVRRVKFIPWNAAIDDYIAVGGDSRSSNVIQEQLKIGRSGGALFRACDGGCGKRERVHTKKLNRCSKCKIAVYCGRDCQLADWPNHKPKCKEYNRDEQPIPSQVAFKEHVLEAKMGPQEKLRVLELVLDYRNLLLI
ncbi:hypothetical protein CALCODRAFT_68617 [Calocera cornea HHB12733]|uniref:MYND-type domain-containing protein n=1 Tax=Calocera cornea HHB12733 TaxID=1353952 RepID=A0A165DJ62_9BASI|nr:hypothetical protein CALCODRAFT_68617 [Calocera cornea HHB12733]